MRLFVLLRVLPAFDRNKLTNPLVSSYIDTLGRYNLAVICNNVTVDQALTIVSNLAADPAVDLFTPLLEYSL